MIKKIIKIGMQFFAHARGTVLKIGTVPVAKLTSIGGLNLTKETYDDSDLSKVYKEYGGAMLDGGEVSIEGTFKPDDEGQEALYAAIAEEDPEAMSIVFPTKIGYTWSFNGLVTAFNTTAAMGGKVSFTATIKVSGQPTLAATPAG